MMSLAAALLLGATLPSNPTSRPDPQAAFDRFRTECTGKKPAPASCGALRLQIEGIVFSALKAAEASALPMDPKALRAAAHAQLPALRAVAVRAIGRLALTPEDEEVLAGAFDDPVPAVRRAVLPFVWKVKQLQPWAERLYEGKVGFIDTVRLWPDSVPTKEELGGPVYPGATYRYFASGPARAFFTTADPPEKVAAFYGTGNRRIMTAAQLRAAAVGGQPDPAAMTAMMRNPEFVRKMMEDTKKLQAMATGGAAPKEQPDWTQGIEDVQGIEAPRYVILQETTMFGATSPSKVVVVWKDTNLRRTAVVFPRVPVEPDPYAGLSMQQRTSLEKTLGAMTQASRGR